MNHRRRIGRSVLLSAILLFVMCPPASFSLTSSALPQTFKTKRPLRMLVLGDSVMWGQGLADEHKFTYLVRQWICTKRNNGRCPDQADVQIHVEAHSGALIAQPDMKHQKDENRFTRSVAPLQYPGEVNSEYPTIWGQVDLARRYYADNSIPLDEVDLILLNGGINDMGAPRILAPKLLGFIAGNINDFARKYCEDDMKLLLDRVAKTFPKARILVPGYFPLVSLSTPENLLTETIRYLFLGKKEQADEKRETKDEAVNPSGAPVVAHKPSKSLVHMANRSRDWALASNAALARAVKSFNSSHPGLQVIGNKSRSPDASERAMFVPVPFADQNTYAAPSAFLWRLVHKSPEAVLECTETSRLNNLIANDEMQSKRGCLCEQAGKKNDVYCLRAGAFHPNIQGADLYFRSITEELDRILPFTGWVAK